MSPVLIVALVVGFLILDVGVLVLVFKTRGRRMTAVNLHFRWLADTLGLSLRENEPLFPTIAFFSFLTAPPRVEGPRRGCDMSIYHWSTGGKNSTTYSTVRIDLENPKGLTASFSREGLLSKLGKGLGMQDVQTGDDQFDKLFIIKCSDPEFIRQALLPEVKERFRTIWETHKAQGTIKLKDNLLSYDEVGTIRNEATRTRIAEVAELMCDLGGIVQFYSHA